MDIALEILKYILPSIIVGLICYFLIDRFLNQNKLNQQFELRKQSQSETSPQRLQAYERLALYLERIKPTALVRRVETDQTTAKAYEYLLIRTIQDEWEHNLSQQIYIAPDTWKIIYSAKNATQNLIKQTSDGLNNDATVDNFREKLISNAFNDNAPSNSALLKMQSDIQSIFS